MSWSIAEVAQMSTVTSRTLRHYDAIGLLKPVWTAPGGRRYYEQEQLLRLQQILPLRDLGLGLEGFAQNYEDVRESLTATFATRWRPTPTPG